MASIRVSVGVLTKGSQILLCQRREQDLHPHKWEFPGGKAYDGEDEATCLRRELHEELGIDAIVGATLQVATHTYPNGRTVELYFFHVPDFRGEIVNTQFQTVVWAELIDLPSYDFLEGDIAFVAALASGKWLHLFPNP